jgi:hypothetical protein
MSDSDRFHIFPRGLMRKVIVDHCVEVEDAGRRDGWKNLLTRPVS